VNPEKIPWSANAAATCQGSFAAPTRAIVAEAKSSVRTNIGFRPMRSETAPQVGPLTMRPIPSARFAIAVQKSAFA